MSTGRVLIAAGVCLVLLSGCDPSSRLGNPFRPNSDDPQAALGLSDPMPPPSDPDATGSIPRGSALPPDPTPVPASLAPDPSDDLARGRREFRAGRIGAAEHHFRRAAELRPDNAEGWLGLAAAYDRLRRFELADEAYQKAIDILGPSPEILNNQGYSYILRGDYERARATLLAARAMDPASPYIKNNLELLAKSARTGRPAR
jgi:tetratricopeptide (TPR) repeat protein